MAFALGWGETTSEIPPEIAFFFPPLSLERKIY